MTKQQYAGASIAGFSMGFGCGLIIGGWFIAGVVLWSLGMLLKHWTYKETV